MAWQYEPTDEELKAAAMLEDKGWSVVLPKCPECNGGGRKNSWKQYMGIPEYNKSGIISGFHFPSVEELEEISPKCSYGCESPSFFY